MIATLKEIFLDSNANEPGGRAIAYAEMVIDYENDLVVSNKMCL